MGAALRLCNFKDRNIVAGEVDDAVGDMAAMDFSQVPCSLDWATDWRWAIVDRHDECPAVAEGVFRQANGRHIALFDKVSDTGDAHRLAIDEIGRI